MTAAVEGRYRTAQDKVTRQAIAPVLGLLSAIPTGTPLTDAQWARLIALILPNVVSGRQTSRDLSADLYRTLAPGARAPEVPVRPYDVAALDAALTRTSREQLTDPVLHTQGVVRGASAVGRHVELAGRDYTRQATYVDDTALGWARVARGEKTCAWCLMLVSRGPVYHTGATAGLNDDGTMNAWHDHCDCQAVPVFDHNDWPGREQYLRASALWAAATGGDGDKLNAFRRVVEDRSPLSKEYRADVEHAARTDSTRIIAPDTEVAAPTIDLRTPKELSDDELDTAMSAAIDAEDWDRFELIEAECNARQERQDAEAAKAAARDAESAARSERRRQQKVREREAQLELMAELVEQGVPEAEAYAEAYGVSVPQAQRTFAIEALRSAGYQGSSFEKLARASYTDHIQQQWLRAEDDCRGALLNREGQARGVDDRTLFSGPLDRALKYASEELVEWWERNGRVTFDGWVGQLLGDATTLNAQRSTARVSSR